MNAALIIGTQLLKNHPALSDDSIDTIIMIEAQDLCGKLPYHAHKLVLLISAMRHYAPLVEASGKKLIYHSLADTPSFKATLAQTLKDHNVKSLRFMKASDVGANTNITAVCSAADVTYEFYQNDLFLTPESDLREWFGAHRKPLMETFYRWQRQRTGILMDGTNPVGGRWNFDAENRKPLPKTGVTIPELPTLKHDDITKAVIKEIAERYANNPGDTSKFWLPTTHDESVAWLERFISERFEHFGDYEDAMKQDEAFLFHGVLSPMINCGLLTVQQVVDAALKAHEKGTASLAATEGFIRQVIGWREYMYGLYLTEEGMKSANFFGFTKELEDWWYDASALKQDLPAPVLGALKTVHEYGYNHHIERLMVLGNWFLINEYAPESVYRWFSALYVDAYEWVMVPNVMGMSQYADGGRTATKPYISGANYLQKMGKWWPNDAAAKESGFTDKYWQFLEHNYDKLKNNHRMSLVLKQVEKRKG